MWAIRGFGHVLRPATPDSRRDAARTGRRRRERGAALVEAAIITPLFMTLLFGVIEWGYAFHDRLTVGNMSVAGVRSASGEANEVLSDYWILQAIRKNSANMPASKITTIVIYRATGPDDTVPAPCKTASVTNTASTRGCNRYTGADLALGQDSFGCVGPPGPTQKIDRYWCPTTRKTALLAGTNGPPDYIGVYVRGVHQNLTGFFGGTYTFTSDTVMRIEPRSLR